MRPLGKTLSSLTLVSGIEVHVPIAHIHRPEHFPVDVGRRERMQAVARLPPEKSARRHSADRNGFDDF